jgi:2-polyprenyl-3-methyl-5-hydroxy-6-metoxy-1,4-benzoquinol methylase
MSLFVDYINSLDWDWDKTGVHLLHKEYILATNERGRHVIDQMETHFVGPMAGKRILDIGSGHGGAAVAASLRGATVVCIEHSEGERMMADLNFRDHNLDIGQHTTDATNHAEMAALGRFDLVLCDNVIEHVDDAQSLIFNIGQVLTPTGVAYVTAPNAFSLAQVTLDCHNREFGLSLLDRFDAQVYYEERGHVGKYSVGDYNDFGQYIWMFNINGMTAQDNVPADVSKAAEERALAMVQAIEEHRAQLNTQAEGGKKVAQRIDRYLEMFDNRFEEMKIAGGALREAFFHHYMIERFDFIVRRKTLN